MTLDELDKLCRQAETVKLPGPLGADGKRVLLSVPVNRLTPAEAARVREIRESVIPPMRVVDEETGQREFDRANPEFLAKFEKASMTARALAIWLGCPMFREGVAAAGLDQIVAHVQSKLTDTMLELIYQKIVEVDGSLGEEVDFFLPAASPSV